MLKTISINLLAMLMLAALAASALAGKNEDPVEEPDSLAELLPVGEATDVRYIDGKLGIGTSSPVANLHVAGSLRADNGMFGFGNSHFDYGEYHDNYFTTGSLGSTYFRTFDGSVYQTLGSVSNEKWRLDRKLEVTAGGATINGDVSINGRLNIGPFGDAGGGTHFDWGDNHEVYVTCGHAGGVFFRSFDGSTYKYLVRIDNDGTFVSYGNGTFTGTVTTGSSRDLKKNISQLSGNEAAEALMSLVPVKYNYKTNGDELELGFIAEDVPDLVARNDRKSLSPMDFAALSVTVIQQQEKRIRSQEEQIDSQQAQIDELRALVGELMSSN